MTSSTITHRPGAWLDTLGGRKFLIAAVVILAACIGLFVGLIDGQIWLAAVGIAVGSYSAANAATHWSVRPQSDPTKTPQINLPNLDLPGIGDDVDPRSG